MKNSLKQEFFKFSHQRIPLYGAIALLILMLYSAVSKSGVSRGIVAQGFGAGQWVTIIMITIASTFMAMEYQNRTIMTLFYKSSNKSFIYFAKLIVITLYGGSLLLLGIVLTFILKMVMVGNRYSWLANYNQHPLWADLLLNILGTLVYLIFIITLAFFLIALIKVNAAVVGVGLAVIFLGADLSALVMSGLPAIASIVKWNPLNMIFVINQFTNAIYAKISGLSDFQLVAANIVYAIIFIVVGDVLFKNRRV